MNASSLRSAARLTHRGYATAIAAAAPDKLRQAFSYCIDQVRTYDYENYVWCTQLPKVNQFLDRLLFSPLESFFFLADKTRSGIPLLYKVLIPFFFLVYYF